MTLLMNSEVEGCITPTASPSRLAHRTSTAVPRNSMAGPRTCTAAPRTSAVARRSRAAPSPRRSLLLDLGRLTHPAPQVVELGPAHVAPGHHVDLADDGAVHGEGSLDADAEAHLAHGEGLPRPGSLPAHDDALEHLDALPVPLHHPDVDPERVAGTEVRNTLPQRAGVDDIGRVHGAEGSSEAPGDAPG